MPLHLGWWRDRWNRRQVGSGRDFWNRIGGRHGLSGHGHFLFKGRSLRGGPVGRETRLDRGLPN
jgi:hypothetical protein